jgi:hypothetical protein
MKTQLDAMVEFLSGQESEEAGRIRSALADSRSDAARFLTATRRLSRAVFAPHVFRGLGLPPGTRERVPDVAPPQPPLSAGRRAWRLLPWLTTALASGAVLWLLLTCPCDHTKPDRLAGGASGGGQPRFRPIGQPASRVHPKASLRPSLRRRRSRRGRASRRTILPVSPG